MTHLTAISERRLPSTTDWSAGATLTQDEVPSSRWLDMVCLLLSGYALFGRGFAYVGISPLFVGEIMLLTGIYVFLRFGNWRYVAPSPTIWPLAAMALWSGGITLFHVRGYGIDALRDAMIWGYSAFALIIMGLLLSEPRRLLLLIQRYEKFIPVYLAIIPLCYFASQLDLVPRWPWANAGIIESKGGDVMSHLAGVLAFWASGLGRRAGKFWLVLLLACVVIVGAANRGGLVAFMVAYGICLLFRPLSGILWTMVALALGCLPFFAAIDLRVELPGKDRELSAEQIVENIWSVVDKTSDSDLDSTKQWRINWWTDIVNYTWNGKYFWTGKGFGINLADSDGYQGTQWEGQLRSPHNGHLTMLARAGVPGFVLWLLPQIVWFFLVLRACVESHLARDLRWNSLFVFLLAYWGALLARASFDVFLEGPVGGVWFWVIYGVGLSAVVIYRYSPETLADQT